MDEPRRPKHVVVVDAENPLEEISGEFFWREDHERILVQECETAYARGFADAIAAAQQTRRLRVRQVRGRSIPRLLVRALLALIVLAYLVSLASNIVSYIHNS